MFKMFGRFLKIFKTGKCTKFWLRKLIARLQVCVYAEALNLQILVLLTELAFL